MYLTVEYPLIIWQKPCNGYHFNGNITEKFDGICYVTL